MKKTFVTVLLAICLLTLPAFAAATAQQNTADALNSLGLFLGKDGGEYALDDQLMRSDGITMLVRLIGKETEAKSGKYSHPFTDVLAWAKGYVGYAYEKGITKGVNEEGTLFGYYDAMDGRQFLTLVLRTLGYSDSGENADFSWDKPYELAKKVGLVDTTAAGEGFTRGEAVEIFWRALDAKVKGTNTKLAKALIADGVFTQSAYDAAAKIQKNGKTTTSGGFVGGGGSISGGGSTGGGSTGGGSTGGGSSAQYPAAVTGVTYEDYINMTGAEQEAIQKSFSDTSAFFDWLGDVMAAWDDEELEVGSGGTIDLGRLG